MDKFVGGDDDFVINKTTTPQKAKALAQNGTVFILDINDKFVIVDSNKKGKDAVLGIMPKADKPGFVDELVQGGSYRYLQPPLILDLPPVQKDALSSSGGGAVLIPSNINNKKKYERPDEE